jgi:peptide/nickel transport system ATP-binding protein
VNNRSTVVGHFHRFLVIEFAVAHQVRGRHCRHELFAQPRHPYSAGLLGSIPRLDAPRGEPLTPIRGSINDVIDWRDGCAFAPRCDRYLMDCLTGTPELTDTAAGHRYRCVNPAVPEGPEDNAAPREESG